MTANLLPCPCCGGEAYISTGYSSNPGAWVGDFRRVYCGTCQLRQLFYRTDNEAIAAWNHRVPSRNGQCDECGKKQADGWALYCVDCACSAKMGCEYPTCQPPEEQQRIAAQVHSELYSGEPNAKPE